MVENLTREKGRDPEDESSWDIVLLSRLIIGLTDKFPKASIVGDKALSQTKKWADTYADVAEKELPEKIIEINFTTALVVQNNIEEIISFIDEIERIVYETLSIDSLVDTIKLVDDRDQTPQRIIMRFSHPKESDALIHVIVDISKVKTFGKFLVKISGLTSKDVSTLERNK